MFGGAVEDIKFAVQFPFEEAPGESHWIGLGLLAGAEVDVMQPVPQHTEVPVGIIDGPGRADEIPQRGLAQFDHGRSLAVFEQA